MSHLSSTNSAKFNIVFAVAASFISMMVAIPVSVAIVSATVHAAPAQETVANMADANYKQYLQGYTQGYLASVKQDNSSNIEVANCASPSTSNDAQTTSSAAPMAQTASYSAKPNFKPLSQKSWSQSVNNSYNTYSSSTNTTNNVTTNVTKNSNNVVGSNNTSSSSVAVVGSAGAVVTTGTTATGSNLIGTDVHNLGSNNTTTNTTNTAVSVDHSFNGSFNTDSNNKTTTVDSGNTVNNTTTNNTAVMTTIDDSFNHVDTTLNNNSNNTVASNNDHNNIHL